MLVRSTKPFSFCHLVLLAAVLLLGSNAGPAQAQLPFFPGAEGYGGTFAGTAPAGGWFSTATTVYHVTNLNDSGPGSFRNAFVENSSNKIIVFDVGGVINLTSDNIDIKNLSNYYIAGQTAPSPVTIYGDMTQLTHSSGKQNTNVILRYLTFRKGTGASDDAITFAGSGLGSNLILDHVSGSWAEDEVLSVANNNTNVTVQYSIIADALVSNHAYGSLIRPRIDSNVSFHHNLYANNASRQARFGTYDAHTLTADFRNNVIYNWRDRASYAGGSSESEQEFVDLNYVGNYLIAGPATNSNLNTALIIDKNVSVRAYIPINSPGDPHPEINVMDSDKTLNPGGNPDPNANAETVGWGIVAFNTPITDQTLEQRSSPFAMPAVTTQIAADAYWQVLDHVGNYWSALPAREAIDARIINNVKTNTGPPNGVAASAPNATELANLLATPMSTHPFGYDTDNDGMSNVWEMAHGLNTSSGSDWNADFDSDGYINLIEYINELGEFPAPAPIEFNGATNSRYAQITNWKTDDGGITTGSNWQPSKYDEAHINDGTVVVDAVGQHAGLLKIGANSSDVAQLNVSSGWLKVEDEVIIGAHASSQGTLSLSGTGVLSAHKLSRGGVDDTFSFTGGVLHADIVAFDLVNQGGVLSPGHSIGDTLVQGDLTLSSGTLQIELAANLLSSDTLTVTGQVTLGGLLDVDLLGSAPSLGNGWQIITSADEILGTFNSITPGYSVQEQGNNLWLYFGAPPGVVGDFDDDSDVDANDIDILADMIHRGASDPGGDDSADLDGVGGVTQDDLDYMVSSVLETVYGDSDLDDDVDGADFDAWRIRDSEGGGIGWATGDWDGDNDVDGADFDHWRERLPAIGGAGVTAVPEPATWLLAALASIGCLGIVRRSR